MQYFSLNKSNTRTWGYKMFICMLSFTGPNSGAGTHYWSARIHRTVHWHTLLWQVPWTRGAIVLNPVLLRLTSRGRWKQTHGQSSICFLCFFVGYFSVCFSKLNISTLLSSKTRLHLLSIFPAGMVNALRENRLTLDDDVCWRLAFKLVLEWQTALYNHKLN